MCRVFDSRQGYQVKHDQVGGFGTLLWLTFDHTENRADYEKSIRLMAEEVMPQLTDLTGD